MGEESTFSLQVSASAISVDGLVYGPMGPMGQVAGVDGSISDCVS